MNAKRKKQNNQERGIALFMAIFALMLLSAIAAGFMFLANTETVINSNYRQSQQAYFGARAGLQEARVRIMRGAGDLFLAGVVPTTAMPSAANTSGGIYIVNGVSAAEAANIQPWVLGNAYFDDTFCKANFANPNLGTAYGTQGVRCTTAPAAQWAITRASTSLNTNTASAMLFKWTRITLKGNLSGSPMTAAGTYPYAVDSAVATANPADDRQVCWDGFKQVLRPTAYTNCKTTNGAGDPMEPVYILTSMGLTPGGSERTLSVEVADDPPFYNNSAVNSQDHVTLNGALKVDGYDSCSCACTYVDNNTSPKTTTYTCTDKPGKTCLRDKYAIYSNSTVDHLSGAQETATAGTTPVIAESQSKITDIKSLIDRYKNMAQTVNTTQAPYNYSCPPPAVITDPPTNPVCGTHSGQTFGIPPVFPSDGSAPPDPLPPGPQVPQVTYAPGDLKITGGSVGNGILVVDGDLEINGGLQFYGLIIVKGVVKFSGGGSDKTNIFGSVLAGVSSVDNTVLGGSAAINYNQCALSNNLTPAPPRLLSSREIEY